MRTIKKISIIVLLFSILSSCNIFKTALYDQYSYQKTIEIMVEAENLMDKATDPYQTHLQEINNLEMEVQKITEYEKNKPNNEITYMMWKLLSDENTNLLMGFFKYWKERKQLNSMYIKQSKMEIKKALTLLIQYEIKKNKETEKNLLQLITE